MKPTLEQCIEGIKNLCKDMNLSEDEIMHRATMVYLMNKLETVDDILILCKFAALERELHAKRVVQNVSTN